MSGPNILL